MLFNILAVHKTLLIFASCTVVVPSCIFNREVAGIHCGNIFQHTVCLCLWFLKIFVLLYDTSNTATIVTKKNVFTKLGPWPLVKELCGTRWIRGE